MSRGIDIDIIDLVINYDVPHDGEDYVHRIGRTARAERDGTAFTLVNPRDQRKFAGIEKLLEKEVPKLPLPSDLGLAPEWKPFERREGGFGGGRGGGGKKPFRGDGKGRPQGGGGRPGGKPGGGKPGGFRPKPGGSGPKPPHA
jgi:Superfamily II DNA and RNA helicases